MPSREEIEALRAAEKEVKEHEREERIKQYRERVANRTGSEIAVEFDHVSKTYKLYKNDRSRFLGLFQRNSKELVGIVNANEDLSFEIKRAKRLLWWAPTEQANPPL